MKDIDQEMIDLRKQIKRLKRHNICFIIYASLVLVIQIWNIFAQIVLIQISEILNVRYFTMLIVFILATSSLILI